MSLFRSYAARWVLGVLAFLAVISVLRFKPWLSHADSGWAARRARDSP